MKGSLKAASFLLLAISLLWWATRDIPIRDIYDTLRLLNPLLLLVLGLINILILLLFALRWWFVMLAIGERLPFASLIVYRLAGFGISYFTPGPQFGGEPLQVHLLRKHHRISGGTALAGVTMDRLVEMLVNFSFLAFGVALIFRSQLLTVSELLLILPVGLLALPLAYLSLLWLKFRPVSWLLLWLPIPKRAHPAFARIQTQIRRAEEQLSYLLSNKTRLLLGTLGVTLLTWAFLIFEYWLSLRLFGETVELGQVIIALTAARIAFLMPLPAGLGALEAGQVAAMQLLGLDPSLGISVSLLIRARDFTLGSLGLWVGGFSVNSIRSISEVQTVLIPVERRDEK